MREGLGDRRGLDGLLLKGNRIRSYGGFVGVSHLVLHVIILQFKGYKSYGLRVICIGVDKGYVLRIVRVRGYMLTIRGLRS